MQETNSRNTIRGMKTNENETLWTATELMNFLGCGKTTFFAAKKKGYLPQSIKISVGVERWNPATVFDWLKASETPPKVNPNRSELTHKLKTRGRPTKESQVSQRERGNLTK